MKTITKIPANLVNAVVTARVSEVSYNRYNRTAKITVLVDVDDNTQLKLSDVVFENSKYSLNDKKHDMYAELFEANSAKLKHLFDNVDFDRNDYVITCKLCVSSRNTQYFAVESYERVAHKISDDTYEAINDAKTEALAELAVQSEESAQSNEVTEEILTEACKIAAKEIDLDVAQRAHELHNNKSLLEICHVDFYDDDSMREELQAYVDDNVDYDEDDREFELVYATYQFIMCRYATWSAWVEQADR